LEKIRKRRGRDKEKIRKRWGKEREEMKIKPITNIQIYKYTNNQCTN
jgi:hypothetical protein